MTRRERLSELALILSDDALHTAEALAARTGVSLRTLYRDMASLAASGLPVTGTPGAGYRLTAPVALPPLHLTTAELEALQLGLAVIAETPDPDLRAAAMSLETKIAESGAAHLALSAGGLQHLPALRTAISGRQKLDVTEGDGTKRIVRPLALEWRGRSWTLLAWSEQDAAFRRLRIEAIEHIAPRPELFVDEPGRRLVDWIERGPA